MLTNLKIRNFKCFSSESINFSDLTLLAGGNASGKSSVIQAFLFHAYAVEKEREYIDIREIYKLNLGIAKELISHNLAGDDNYIEIETVNGNNSVGVKFKTNNKLPYTMETVYDVQKKYMTDIKYLKAERIGPQVTTDISGSLEDLGYSGEFTPSVIANADIAAIRVHKKLKKDRNGTKFSILVENWMSAIMGDMTLDITTDNDKGFTYTKINNIVTDYGVLPTLTGFGISYTLPIVVAGLLCSAHPNSILIIENPEAHLHPMAQSNIGKFLAIVAQCGVQVIIETHSEHIVDGARVQLKIDNETDKMLINFFEAKKGRVTVEPISINENGELTHWPKGFFDQKQTDLRALLKK